MIFWVRFEARVEIAKINEKTKIQGFSVLDWSQWISAFLVWVNCCWRVLFGITCSFVAFVLACFCAAVSVPHYAIVFFMFRYRKQFGRIHA